MMPEHCRHVSVHHVTFELNTENIKKELLNSKIYKGTEHLILNNDDDWAVIRIGKTPARGLFWVVSSVEILSLPNDTIYRVDPTVDVLNKNAMGQVANANPSKLIIVKGTFEHVSFIKSEVTIELDILEVVPPIPPKLTTMVKNLLKIRSFEKPIIINERIIDIASMLNDDKTKTYMLPCNASGLETKHQVYYLDERPKLNSHEKDGITLVGCNLSLKIFKELYEFEPQLINICPAELAGELVKTKPVLIKCCKAKTFERANNLFMVPWGATYHDLEEALNDLVNDFKKGT